MAGMATNQPREQAPPPVNLFAGRFRALEHIGEVLEREKERLPECVRDVHAPTAPEPKPETQAESPAPKPETREVRYSASYWEDVNRQHRDWLSAARPGETDWYLTHMARTGRPL